MPKIEEPRQIAALASPVRLAVFDAIEAIGPCSVADIARVTGVRADGLYYHLRILERHKLIRIVEDGDTGSRGARVDALQRPLELRYQPERPGNVRAVTKVVTAMTRAALRTFTRAFALSPRVTGKRRELWAGQRNGRLSAAQVAEVNSHLQRILDILASSRTTSGGEGRLYSMTFLFSPVDD